MRDADKTCNRVRIPREDAGMSRAGLAEKPGINHWTLGYIEREDYVVSLVMARRISEIFGLPLGLIFANRPMGSVAEILQEDGRREVAS